MFNAAGPSPRIDAETRLNIARDILPTCDAAQLKDMFGPVNRYVVEREGIGMGATFSAPGGELIQELFAA